MIRLIKYWPADIHIIGKDILRFPHLLATFLSAGLKPPKKVWSWMDFI